MAAFVDLVGKRFERLTVIGCHDKNKWGNYRWKCLCDCGKIIIVRSGDLKSRNTKSCGCFQSERVTTHGYCYSKTYHIWQSMKDRCLNQNNHGYKDYGGRGISVCNRWLKFENFLKDVGEIPNGFELDRINNNGNYSPKNCKLSTRKEQTRNTRRNRIILFDGKNQCLSAWAEEYNMSKQALKGRLDNGWPIKKALETPVGKYKRRKNNDIL